VDQAGPGDEVVICAGAVTLGDVTVVADDFLVRGETGDPADVVLTNGVLRILPSVARGGALRGLTLATGASLDVMTNAPFTLADVIVRDHDATEGTAVSLQTSVVEIYRARFTNNVGQSALFIQRPTPRQARVRMYDVTFDHNAAQTWLASVWGAGQLRRGTLSLTQVTFEDNQADGYPLFADGDGYKVLFRDVVVRRNQLGGSAIEIWYDPGGSMMDGLTVTDNQMEVPALFWGSPSTTSTLQHAVFERNTGPAVGGRWPNLAPLEGYAMTLRLRDVDFGSGIDANSPYDIAGCASPVGYVAQGLTSSAAPCP